MQHPFRQWLTPPTFSNDQEKTFRARLLYAITILIVIMLIGNTFFIISSSVNLRAELVTNLCMLAILGFCIYWTKQGYVYRAGVILSAVLWLGATFVVYLYGPRDVIIGGYILVIIIAALVTSGRGGLIVVFFSSLAFTLVALGEMSGGRPSSLPATLPAILRIQLQLYVAVGLLLYGANYVIIQALSQAQQSMLAVRASEERLNRIITAAPISMGLVNAEGRFFQVNEAMCLMLGYDEAELIRKNLNDITHPDDIPSSFRAIGAILAGDAERLQLEKRYVHKQGSIVWGIITLQIVPETAVEKSYFIVQVQDISQRKQAEEALQQQQNHLEELVQDRTAEWQQANAQLQQEVEERRRIEGELRLHEAIVENMAEGVHLVRTDNATVIYANPTLERMFAYEPDELLGQPVAMLNAPTAVSPEQTAAVILKSLHTTGYWRGEVQNIKKNGQPFWCAAHVSTFENEQYGTVWVSVHEDITQRKQIEEELAQYRYQLQDMVNQQTAELKTTNAQLSQEIEERKLAEQHLRQAEERYRTIAELTSDFAYSTGITAEGHTELEWITHAFTRILGYSVEELVGRNAYLDTVYAEDIDLVIGRVQTLMAGTPAITEYRSVTRSGEIRWLRDYGHPVWDEAEQRVIRVYGAAQDITQQKQAEAELMNERALLRAVIDNLPDYIYLKDWEHRIILSNQANARTLGATTVQEVIGKTLADFYPAEEAERYNALDKAILRSGQAVINQENSFVDLALAQPKWSLITRLPFRDSNGDIIGILGVSRDITERKRAEILLQNRLRFELHLAYISANFNRLSGKAVDQGIDEAIQRVAEVMEVVRGSVFRFDSELEIGWNTHEWCAEPQDSQKEELQGFYTQLFGWYFTLLKQHKVIAISRLADLPPTEAKAEREWAIQMGFRSLLFVPLLSGDKLIGALGFYGAIDQEIEWPDEYISLLQLVADIIVNALSRQQVEHQINVSLREKEVLLKEIHHRVKNNLQVISSLLDLQSIYTQDDTVREMFQESRSRVRSMALVHEQLYQASDLARIDFADYTERLTSFLLRSYGRYASSVKMKVVIAPLLLSVEIAIPLGLIINELVTNSLKHAFRDGRSGQITIQLDQTDANHITLTISDDGLGLPPHIDPADSPSLGLTIVATLAEQLQSHLEWDRQPGTRWRITLPYEPPLALAEALLV